MAAASVVLEPVVELVVPGLEKKHAVAGAVVAEAVVAVVLAGTLVRGLPFEH